MANQISNNYQNYDLVRVADPKFNRCSVNRPTLPCKLLAINKNNYYQLEKFGIVNVYYCAGELKSLDTIDVPELNTISSNEISFREAVQLQSVDVIVKGAIVSVVIDIMMDDHARTKHLKYGWLQG
ncbi:2586_t:CDS:2 [Ambispora gerdemannii]|uniref:2586_t:CDS:1 n=1 Tax=Ambispora gerdemannii TaxID=144530 RepID=A0A9N9DR28_9GLOM|nr:2586_t:CDS:2 [Ambispora gerdemannii]